MCEIASAITDYNQVAPQITLIVYFHYSVRLPFLDNDNIVLVLQIQYYYTH